MLVTLHTPPQPSLLAARLLSGRDEPSVLEQEAILEQVLRRVEPPRARARSIWGAAALVAAAACALLWSSVRTPSGDTGELAVRGGEGAHAGSFAIACLGPNGAQSRCLPGMKLSLELQPPSGRPFFALLARRPDGAMIWYFPKPDAPMPFLGAQQAGAPWSEAPVLERAAPAGSYTWYGVFAERALSRSELRAALGDDLHGGTELTVLERTTQLEREP